MGLLIKLLLLPITAPLDGVLWLAETINDQAEQELYNEPAVRGQMVELELRLEMGEISEEEYQIGEDALLVQLRTIRAWQAARI
ncbi:MAG: gas vesicle protein GvpG [Roseiflexaceae bacterium]|nr:gas vesicle protein GvpG [Roseiflexaceae bacterium]